MLKIKYCILTQKKLPNPLPAPLQKLNRLTVELKSVISSALACKRCSWTSDLWIYKNQLILTFQTFKVNRKNLGCF